MVFVPLILLLVTPSFCSWGDRAPVYRQCKESCDKEMCRGDSLKRWALGQSMADFLVGWSCSQDCSYTCMWNTVEVYTQHGRVPQFYGKWPFIRVLGIQEPISVLASLLNLATNCYMIFWITKTVSNKAPMYWVWVIYGLTAVNAWIWSSVFHTMDAPSTEMADYFSALATVLSSLWAFCMRLLPRDLSKQLLITSFFVAFFSHHVYHMAFIHFDYGYNMKVNVASGGLNCLAWLAWFFIHRHGGSHIKYGVLAVLLVASSVSLELLDFPPIYWLLDSHALWHFATVPLPLLWVKFAVADTMFLEKNKEGKVE